MTSPSEDTKQHVVEHWSAARLPTVDLIRDHLQTVFPQGLDARAWAVAERAARSLYVFLYTFSIEGVTDHRVRPAMVTTMSEGQAALTKPSERFAWWEQARRARSPQQAIPGRWYAENTREPIRDETFRVWKEYGALLEDSVPTTSSVPRYRLARDFADLFDPELQADELQRAIKGWQARHLTPAARARVALVQQQTSTHHGAHVRFPDGSTRPLSVGPSAPLLKAAVESFAPSFLYMPVVLLVTESRRRLAYQDADQLRRIGLKPDPRVMPDLLLADLGVPSGELRLVLMECVATAGAMTRERIASLRDWLTRGGFGDVQTAFGTVFSDRGNHAFRRFVGELAWGTFCWFASEPTNLMVLLESGAFDPRGSLDSLARPLREC